MIRRRLAAACLFAFAVSAAAWTAAVARVDLPPKLTDQEFWALSEELSEPNGYFRSDNLLSNELGMQSVIPDLIARLGVGGVYMGVGPEQNFTYIAALKPRIAFIVDIRRGNRDLHLMYKALFEMSADRADFVSLLFSRRRPDGLSTTSTAAEMFAAYEAVSSDGEYYRQNSTKIRDLLLKKHGFPLTDEEVQGVQYVYDNFFQFGPAINYSSSSSGRSGAAGTYAALMRATDRAGESRSYLATEANFLVLKDLEAKNLLVPLVGNFGGPTAIRAVGAWLKARGAVVSAFYLSNVESYLGRDGLAPPFCQNVAALPLDEKSSFIRSGPSVLQRLPPPTATTTPPQPTPPQTRTLVLIPRTAILGGSVQGGRGFGAANQTALMADEVKSCSTPQIIGK